MRKCKTWIAGFVAVAASGSVAVAEDLPFVLDDVALDTVSAGLSNVNANFSIDTMLLRGMSMSVLFNVQGVVADQSIVTPTAFVPLNLARSSGTIFAQNQGTSPSIMNTVLSFGVSLTK